MRKSEIAVVFMMAVACASLWAGSAAVGRDAKEESRLRLPDIRLHASKYVFSPEEKIPVVVSIDNTGEAPMRLFDSGLWDPRARRVAPEVSFVLRRDGQDGIAQGQSGEKPVDGKNYFMLNPGDMSQSGIDLVSWCGKLAPGRYSFVIHRMVGNAVADSNVFIFEVADENRMAEIDSIVGVAREFLRGGRGDDIMELMSHDGVWVEIDKGRRMLYVRELAGDLVRAKGLPRSKRGTQELVYLPAYDAVFLDGGNNDGGELFFLRPEAGRYRVRSIRDLR